MEEFRIGFIGIVLEDRSVASEVNALLGQHSHVVRARIGVPDTESQAAVIGLIVEGTNTDLGALTAKLGNLHGVQVKSALAKRRASAED